MIHNCQHQNNHILCPRVTSTVTISSQLCTRRLFQHTGCKRMLCQHICKTTANSTRPDTALESTEEGYFLESLVSSGAGLEPHMLSLSQSLSQPPACLGTSIHQPSVTHTGETKEKSWRRMKEKRRKDYTDRKRDRGQSTGRKNSGL